MNVPKKRRRYIPIVVIVLACMTLWASFHIGRWGVDLIAQRIWIGSEVFQELPFSRSEWLSYKKYEPKNIRKRMYHDLVSHHLHVGMNRREVEDLLGNPEYKRDADYYYYLGPDAGKLDTIELLVEFDHSGKVVAFRWHAT